MKFFKKLKILILSLLIIFLVASIFIIRDGYNLYKDATSRISIERKITSIQNRNDFMKLDSISKDFTNALLAIEDHRFYEHGAIDIVSIGRAIVTDLKARKLAEGGSTISQQLAKNLYFTQEKKFTRKIAEVFVAYDLEKNYSKDEILEVYIATLYFGDGYNGLFEASKGYFDKSPINLTFSEATMLAGIPNAPSVYALSNNSDLSYQRQKQVVEAMVKYEYITSEEAMSKLN